MYKHWPFWFVVYNAPLSRSKLIFGRKTIIWNTGFTRKLEGGDKFFQICIFQKNTDGFFSCHTPDQRRSCMFSWVNVVLYKERTLPSVVALFISDLCTPRSFHILVSLVEFHILKYQELRTSIPGEEKKSMNDLHTWISSIHVICNDEIFITLKFYCFTNNFSIQILFANVLRVKNALLDLDETVHFIYTFKLRVW